MTFAAHQRLTILLVALVLHAGELARPASPHAQQVADTLFHPPIPAPAFRPGRGPVIAIDEGHSNFHTAAGRFEPFARLARRDGFVVHALSGRLTRAGLDSARVLVIANALEPRNESRWRVPIHAAFDSSEVQTIAHWVREGGSLLLIADHMPFGGAAASLAAAFGVTMADAFAFDAAGESRFVLRRSSGLLRAHPITEGRGPEERVDSVVVFTGQAFRATRAVDTLLVLGRGAYLLLPEEAWKFKRSTPRADAEGALVAAAFRYGLGRVVVFGEAAMLTAQLAGPHRMSMGMNSPEAAQHPRLVLNTLRWLAGREPGPLDAPLDRPSR